MKKSEELEALWNQWKGKEQALSSQLREARIQKKHALRSISHHEEAAEILQDWNLKLQNSIQFCLSQLGTDALKGVFPWITYDFNVEFVQRRNQIECDCKLDSQNSFESLDPLTDVGGGLVDVLSFALRLAIWSLSRPKTEPLLIMDEPFRYVALQNLERAGELIQKISKQLNVRILLITHSDELAQKADQAFFVAKDKKGITNVCQAS